MRALADAAGAPLGGVLEGGYDLEALARSCAAALRAFATDGAEPRPVEPHPLAAHAVERMAEHWPGVASRSAPWA
jgi:acetoin utilization deacetylase AcuC-like enzyme